MLFLVRRIILSSSCFHNRLRLFHSSSILQTKQINDDISENKQLYRTGLLLPDYVIQKYLDHLVAIDADEHIHEDSIPPIMKVREVRDLLKDRAQIAKNIGSLEELGNQDEEIKRLGHDEYVTYQKQVAELDKELLEIILDSTGRDDCRDIVFEMTAGVGGQEAMLFTADLLNMYEKHFDYLGFTYDAIELDTETGIGGLRHVTILVSGMRSFELLRHEGGVHRVQRIPLTERTGRMHTSTTSIAVLPQPTNIEVQLHERDLIIEAKRASGAGGQSVNTTNSAVRITHVPTGIMVEAQSERSQIQNKKNALIKLKAKIYDLQLNEQKSEQGLLRKKQRGMGQRNEKIRTYNYSQDRITDHRLTEGTLRNLKGFMEGGESLHELQERLQRNFQLKLLREMIEKYK